MGAVVCSGAPSRLTAAGWAAAEQYGIRTVIDLRNDDELIPDLAPRPSSIETRHLPLDGIDDTEFWAEWTSGPQFGTPLYYEAFLERFPERIAGVLGAIAEARPGSVLVHCVAGRDRTGLVGVLLLALAGARPEQIATAYELGASGVGRLPDRSGEAEEIELFLRGRGTSSRERIIDLAGSLDVERLLREGGMADDTIAALRARLTAWPLRGQPAS